MKVYISSTYQDLIEHRAAVDRTLRRMGHDVIGMEQYVAEGAKPVDRCQADVRVADAYVIVVAWSYGFVPNLNSTPTNTRSMTEIELQEAQTSGKPIFPFLLDPQAAWPPNRVDAMGGTAGAGQEVARLRTTLSANYLAGMFRTPDDLASQVAAAVSAQGLTRHMVDRVLAQTSVASQDMEIFAKGDHPVSDTSIISIKTMIQNAGTARSLVLQIDNGQAWWSTRLFLLASLLRALTAMRQLVFRDDAGRFVGMATPAAVMEGLAAAFPELDEISRRLRFTPPQPSADIQRETDRQLAVWNGYFTQDGVVMPGAIHERDIKVGIRPPLLGAWLGERWVGRCIRVDGQDLNMTQVQQIVDSLLPDVPIQRNGTNPAGQFELLVVDRDAFALELAREWVRSGLPRTAVR